MMVAVFFIQEDSENTKETDVIEIQTTNLSNLTNFIRFNWFNSLLFYISTCFSLNDEFIEFNEISFISISLIR